MDFSLKSCRYCHVAIFARADSKAGNAADENDYETCKNRASFLTTADVLSETRQHKNSRKDYRRCSPRSSIGHSHDLFAPDSVEETVPSDNRKLSDFTRSSMTGYGGEEEAKCPFCKDCKDDSKICAERHLQVPVEDLFTRRKLSTEEQQQLLPTSCHLDDVIHIRADSADASQDDDDDDDATVAKQPVVTSATVNDRLVFLRECILTT